MKCPIFQCSTFGFESAEAGQSFMELDRLKIIKLAVSLGGTESLASYRAGMTHVDMTDEARAAAGISAGMVRLSIGMEEPEDLIADLQQALV